MATITARNDLVTIREFIDFCETIQAVSYGLSDMIRIPKTDDQDEICDDLVTRQEAKAILEHLGKFEYPSHRHVIFLNLWKTGMRLSGLRPLDLDDFDEGPPALEIRHRPNTGTPLKKEREGRAGRSDYPRHSQRDNRLLQEHAPRCDRQVWSGAVTDYRARTPHSHHYPENGLLRYSTLPIHEQVPVCREPEDL